MGRYRRYEGTLTTDAAGDGTLLLGPAGDGAAGQDRPAALENGEVHSVIYTKVDFDNTADFTITTATTGQNVWGESNVTASKTVFPRPEIHDDVGAIAPGLREARGIPLVSEQLSIVVAQGGNTKSGTFTLIVRS